MLIFTPGTLCVLATGYYTLATTYYYYYIPCDAEKLEITFPGKFYLKVASEKPN